MFWLVATGLGFVVTAPLLWALLRPHAGKADNAAVQVFKDQLAEVESDLARGVLTPDEAGALRTEVSRRLLAAADAGAQVGAPAPAGATGALAVGLGIVILAGGGALYMSTGAPGLPDQPLAKRIAENAQRYAARPSQAEVEALLDERGEAPEAGFEIPADQLALLDRLRAVLAERPDDLRGHRLLASNLASLGQWRDAAVAQADVVRIVSEDATATDYEDLAEYRILAVNGYVSPEAEAALIAALNLNTQAPRARYYSGLGALQAGRADLTYDLWMRLLAEGPATAPWVGAIRGQIAEVALAAGRPVPQDILAGPSAEQVEAAGEMSPAEREDMIRGMVNGLSDRLATEGGPAQDWARLIRALGVLGERSQASEIWGEAQGLFAASPTDLSIIRQAAQDAEVIQ